MLISESTLYLSKQGSVVFTCCCVYVLKLVARSLPNIAVDATATKCVGIDNNVINTSFRFFAKVRATSIEMGVDSNEVGINKELSKKFSIGIFPGWLSCAYVRVASNGPNTYMCISIKCEKYLCSLGHFLPNSESPFKQKSVALVKFGVRVRCNVQDHA